MEALVIITILFLVMVTAFFGMQSHDNANKVSRFKKQFEHQKEELQKAAFVNARLRTELGDMRAKFIRAAQYVERLEHKLEQPTAPMFSPDDLKTLINLCHPGCHDGKESAHRITQVLLKMRR